EEASEKDEVLDPREVIVDGGELAGEAHPAADRVRLLRHVVSEDPRDPGVRPEERGEDADGGGLARAVRAEDAVHPALRDGEVEPVDRLRVPEMLDQAYRFDGQLCRHAWCPSW